jgi:outer membrane protein
MGAVNLSAAIRECREGKDAYAKLRKIYDDRQRSLDELQAQWKVDKDAVEQSKKKGSPEYTAAMDALQKRLVKLQQTYAEYQKDINDKDAQASNALAGRARGCASQIGDLLALRAVYDKSDDTVLWSRGGVSASDEASRGEPRAELTMDVVRCLDGEPAVAAVKASAARAASVDMNRAVLTSKAASAAMDQLKQLHAQRQKELDEAQAKLTAERDALEARKKKMPEARFKKESESFQARLEQLQAQFITAQAELQKREQELSAPLLVKARECASTAAQASAVAAVFDRFDESVIWVRPEQDPYDRWLRRQIRTDMTAEVTRCLDTPR